MRRNPCRSTCSRSTSRTAACRTPRRWPGSAPTSTGSTNNCGRPARGCSPAASPPRAAPPSYGPTAWSSTGRTWKARSTSAASGSSPRPTWTPRWPGAARPPPRPPCRSRSARSRTSPASHARTGTDDAGRDTK